jgi:hypothetical protein
MDWLTSFLDNPNSSEALHFHTTFGRFDSDFKDGIYLGFFKFFVDGAGNGGSGDIRPNCCFTISSAELERSEGEVGGDVWMDLSEMEFLALVTVVEG